MGCCNSKEKVPKPTTAPAAAPKAEAVAPVTKTPTPAPTEAAKSEVVKEEEAKQLTPQQERLGRVIEARNSTFSYSKCTVDGEVSSFFPPKGLCFRIVRDGTWYFYNDTLNYEMHVSYTFSPDSNITPGNRTTTKSNENGWIVVSAVVYPLETIEFVSGGTDLYKTEVSAEPLSEEFYKNLQPLSEAAENELRQMRELAPGSSDEETRLRRCVETKTPYTDLSFAPSANMLWRNGIDSRRFPTMEFRRPRECLEKDNNNTANIDVFRGAVIPQCIEKGLLGDHWFMCAVAILAQDEQRLKELFTHSVDEEKSLGAYRVQFNLNGWWNSILLDDFLPTVNGVPCFARVMDDPYELWVSLLQKAYAKMFGSYASITGGDAAHALRDFTGAPSCRYDDIWKRAKEMDDDFVINAMQKSKLEGHIVVLNTPLSGSGCVNVGLREGFTYEVVSVHPVPAAGLTLLKMRNPWDPATPWTGPWSADSMEWQQQQEVRESCNPDFTEKDGTFWIEFKDALKYFDGCAVIFTSDEPTYDHRVRGEFNNVHPSVVLMVHAVEPVDVVLTLTQRDKRGLPLTDPDALLSPIMLSVSRGDGNKQHVDKCTSESFHDASDTYNFVVSREVSMPYRFEASPTPYFVIPRIHRKGTSEGRMKEFVVGIRSATPLEGKLDVQLTKIDSSNCVFRNRLTFVVEDTTEVIRPMQMKPPGETVVMEAGSKLSTADYKKMYPVEKTPASSDAVKTPEEQEQQPSYPEEKEKELDSIDDVNKQLKDEEGRDYGVTTDEDTVDLKTQLLKPGSQMNAGSNHVNEVKENHVNGEANRVQAAA
ncbi:cytoskeleton-associated protein CAP5.5 [Trypanosoma theileri]|uniref:Cytoskeleton-associated protein CAP5.5 n=1 Tax=Trypanosoma theileri TaxID=67003 RepID=A0A1X0NKX8_9TRYP|nr:cytoskeleton-associated protein CAP5.5 [Trypanosoma theileri]ORC84770.1 cytoskeleton-associated protein CAP5.5 [Trypanosoma theileri]